MQYFNHYSAPILAAVLLAGGLSLVLRRGGKMRQWLVFGGAMVALGTAWWMFRPVATPATAVAGLPWLLELQSPYCLACVAIKPAVDRLERELQGQLALRRVDIQSAEGRNLASQYGIELTPTFILFDSSGQEQWRSVGRLDAARVRTSLQQGDQVRIFLSGRGVEIDKIADAKFDVKKLAREVLDAGGEFLACGTCLKLRESEGSEICPLSTLKDHYEVIRDSDRVITV